MDMEIHLVCDIGIIVKCYKLLIVLFDLIDLMLWGHFWEWAWAEQAAHQLLLQKRLISCLISHVYCLQKLEADLPWSTEELELVFDGLDSDNDGCLTIEEFTAGLSMHWLLVCDTDWAA